ncbi:MAG: XRE family transcriptional regulator [Peptoniphilus sp.]|nr:XRE family transcriptional regulator [Peptoniphilus sp.]MDD7363581.1 XRE family transcriptional regulator [Bacillota bacterium]MDY6045228.1 XRE family transcriptional regulator [Peptoniphilus sp.]
MDNEIEMSFDALRLGQTLREERNRLGYTLDEASHKTGVSKTMLSQIERGESSPTVSTIWKISTGLRIPLATLLSNSNKSDYKVLTLDEAMPITENHHVLIQNIFSFDPLSPLDGLFVTLRPNSKYQSTGHNNALREYIFVIDGELIMHVGTERFIMHKFDTLSFEGDEEHSYENISDEPVSYLSLIKY